MNTAEILETIHRRVDISGVRADVSMEELRKIAAAAKHYRFICAFALPCFTPYLLSFLRDEPDIHVGATIGAHSGPGTLALFFLSDVR